METGKTRITDHKAIMVLKSLRKANAQKEGTAEVLDYVIGRLMHCETAIPVVDIVTEESGVTLGEMRSKNKARGVVIARAITAWLLRKSGYLFREIGVILERSHATIMYMCEEVDYWQLTPSAYAREMELLERVTMRFKSNGNKG